MYQHNFAASILAIIGATASPTIANDYVQLGFLGILLTILIWYSKRSYSEGIRRDKAAELEKKETIERYESKLKALNDHHERAIEAEKQRYHELHLEVLTILKVNRS